MSSKENRSITSLCRSGVIFFLIAPATFGQGIIHGRTQDDSKSPLPYVAVNILNTKYFAISKLDGQFEIKNIPPGRYPLQAQLIGYKKAIVHEIVVEDSKTTFVELELKEDAIMGEAIVVSATRREQTSGQAPVSVSVVGRDNIERRALATFDQALDGVSGVQLTRSSGAAVQAVSIRGSSDVAGGGVGNRVLLLIDGRPALSPESGGALWTLVPNGSIERVEIVKGAFSSLYGSSAMGGVINVITKKPDDQTQTAFRSRYGFFDRAPTYTDFRGYHDFYETEITHSQRFGKLSVLANAGLQNSNGYKDQSQYRMANLYLKSAYAFSDKRSLTFSGNVNHIKNDGPATWLSFLKPLAVAPWRYDDTQTKWEWSGDVYYSSIPDTKSKYSSRLYHYQQNTKYVFNAHPNRIAGNINIVNGDLKQRVPEETIRAQRSGFLNQLDFSLGDHYVIGGTEIQYDHTVALPDSYLYGRHNAYNIATYVQDEWTWKDQWTVTSGFRYDYYKIMNGFRSGRWSPKISTVLKINQELSLRFLMAQAFRNPSIAEQYAKYEQGGNLYFEQNPNLKPERLRLSLEFGSRYHSDLLTADGSVFWNDYRDLIAYEARNSKIAIFNLDRVLMKGAEVNAELRPLRNLSVGVGYTYLDAQDKSKNRSNNTLAYRVRHSGNASGDYQLDRYKIHVDGRFSGKIREVSIYPGDEPKSYFIINAKLVCVLKFSAHPSEVFFAVNNLTDESYQEIERYPMPRRSYSIGISYRM